MRFRSVQWKERKTSWEILPGASLDKENKILCKCKCGKIKAVNYYNVIKEQSKSCGCSRRKPGGRREKELAKSKNICCA